MKIESAALAISTQAKTPQRFDATPTRFMSARLRRRGRGLHRSWR
jgi:hypothetical protein